jgi:hypothetical protein
MHVRQAGGLQKRQGRYKKDDTARKLFINTVAFPVLRAGVLPTNHDEKMLFLGPKDNKNLPAQDVSDLKRWVDEVHRIREHGRYLPTPTFIERQRPSETRQEEAIHSLAMGTEQCQVLFCARKQRRPLRVGVQGVFRQVL